MENVTAVKWSTVHEKKRTKKLYLPFVNVVYMSKYRVYARYYYTFLRIEELLCVRDASKLLY